MKLTQGWELDQSASGHGWDPATPSTISSQTRAPVARLVPGGHETAGGAGDAVPSSQNDPKPYRTGCPASYGRCPTSDKGRERSNDSSTDEHEAGSASAGRDSGDGHGRS